MARQLLIPRGHSLMVKFQPSKLAMRVRFPLPALFFLIGNWLEHKRFSIKRFDTEIAEIKNNCSCQTHYCLPWFLFVFFTGFGSGFVYPSRASVKQRSGSPLRP